MEMALIIELNNFIWIKINYFYLQLKWIKIKVKTNSIIAKNCQNLKGKSIYIFLIPSYIFIIRFIYLLFKLIKTKTFKNSVFNLLVEIISCSPFYY